MLAMMAAYKRQSDWIPHAILQDFFNFSGVDERPAHIGGWNTPLSSGSQAGKYYSPRSIGHLGFTGCSIWADLQQNWWVVLLSNRVHLDDTKEKIKSFRAVLHDAVYEELIMSR